MERPRAPARSACVGRNPGPGRSGRSGPSGLPLVAAAAAGTVAVMFPAYAAASRQPSDNKQVITVDPDAFEEMVGAALDSLPPEFAGLIQNVAVLVEHGPGPRGLLGLYEGVPLTSRTTGYAGVLPDRITIYQRAICAICDTEADVVEQVRRTVIHEVGHYFGISDERLRELGW